MTDKPKFQYQCTDCGATYNPFDVQYMCPSCNAKNTADEPPKGVLKTIYDYNTLKKQSFEALAKHGFIDILPIKKTASLPNLTIGQTPLYEINNLDGEALEGTLFLKDDAQNPTFSYKDRASAVVSAYAKENGINTIVTASTGNAGSSLAGICAAQGQRGIIMVPAAAPAAKLTQIVMYGATLIPVDGTYDDAFDLSIKATETLGWYNRNTAFNPLTIEGKKTVAFELYEQLGRQTPDRVFVPVGDGVIISGVFKGFEDLLKLDLIEKMPTIVAVQSTGSDNIARNFTNDDFEVKQSQTIADSISVDIPRNYHMAKKFLKTYNGEVLAIEDQDILEASRKLAGNTGLFAEPAAAAAFGGFLHYKKHHKLESESKNVVLLTGSGLKDLKAVKEMVQIPEPIQPNIDNLKKYLS